MIVAQTGSRSQLVSRELPSDDPVQRRPDITLAQEHLGWTPNVELSQGIAKTIAYFEDLLNKPARQMQATS